MNDFPYTLNVDTHAHSHGSEYNPTFTFWPTNLVQNCFFHSYQFVVNGTVQIDGFQE